MKQEDIDKLVKIRKYIIECHDSLDGAGNNNSLVKQYDVAHEYTQLIKMTDDLLGPYVSFE